MSDCKRVCGVRVLPGRRFGAATPVPGGVRNSASGRQARAAVLRRHSPCALARGGYPADALLLNWQPLA